MWRAYAGAVGEAVAMFGFGKVFCLLCDHRVARSQTFALPGRRDVAVCRACRIAWYEAGGTCARCKASVRTPNDVGVFLDRYALGHIDCGAAQLAR